MEYVWLKPTWWVGEGAAISSCCVIDLGYYKSKSAIQNDKMND